MRQGLIVLERRMVGSRLRALFLCRRYTVICGRIFISGSVARGC